MSVNTLGLHGWRSGLVWSGLDWIWKQDASLGGKHWHRHWRAKRLHWLESTCQACSVSRDGFLIHLEVEDLRIDFCTYRHSLLGLELELMHILHDTILSATI